MRSQSPNQKRYHKEDDRLRHTLALAGWEAFSGLAFLYVWRVGNPEQERRYQLISQSLEGRLEAMRRAVKDVL